MWLEVTTLERNKALINTDGVFSVVDTGDCRRMWKKGEVAYVSVTESYEWLKRVLNAKSEPKDCNDQDNPTIKLVY